MTTVQLLIGALTLVTNAFFVAAEFALISVRRSQVEPAARRGETRARITLWGLEHISQLMATAQLGITVSSLVLGAVAEPAIAHLLEPAFAAVSVPDALVHPIAFVLALTAATYAHMLFGEMVPKNIALAAPVPTALFLGPPLVALTRALRPLVFAINAFANTLLRLLRVEPKDEVGSVFTDDELARLVEDSSEAGLLTPADGERLRDALELGTRPVGEIALPAARMRTVPATVTPAELERAAVAAKFSRFPVTGTGGAGDQVLGYLHIKDTLGVAERDKPFPRSALHPVTRVRPDTPLDDTLTALRAEGSHLAAVTGEGGAVIGYVTMEDVLEELVGPAAPAAGTTTGPGSAAGSPGPVAAPGPALVTGTSPSGR
ncbi:hemolysin family protein [Streptomyces sp. LP05-1]|uniref:Hemolysin family protein n=1 Tax=Streptomyces pyxinae TaxID=2970734 RepID=A0ABT2CEJ1_9ACTN|nr:hemolysin family protein [Streptomyces sp. LP05-1]MCS0635059.1 hemolysin family protein [Streptomyces sp. LP05-1]